MEENHTHWGAEVSKNKELFYFLMFYLHIYSETRFAVVTICAL